MKKAPKTLTAADFPCGPSHPRAKCCWCEQPLCQTLDGSAWRCPSDACLQRQLNYAVRDLRKDCAFYNIPLPIQAQLYELVLARKFRQVLFGGAAGVSKSHGLRWLAHVLCNSIPGFRVLLLRRKFTELENSHLSRVDHEAPIFGAAYIDSKRIVEYRNASILRFGHCADVGDEKNYLSDEYDLIIFDEFTTFEVRQIQLVSSRARSTKPNWKPMVVSGTNPGGVSAQYCRDFYINKNPDPQQYPYYDPKEYHYLAGTLDDNPYLSDEYEKSLMQLPEELRRAYRYGDWDIFEGQYFTEWRKEQHTADYQIPRSVDRFCCLDWGYLRPGVCLWIACLADGRLFVEDEYVFRQTLARDVAKEIHRRNVVLGIKPRYIAADPAMWIKDGQSGESLAETFAKHKVPLRKANHERVNGWQRVRDWLRIAADGRPWLQVSPRCAYLARTLPALVMDAHHNKPEDVDTRGEDHAADALRYGLMSRPAPTRERTDDGWKVPAWVDKELSTMQGQNFVLGRESSQRVA